jgi:nitrile hydratase accessory protein
MTPDLDAEGPAAPPRLNGELAFDEPWQGRVFATTMALCEAGVIDYADFRGRLIVAIGERDLAADPIDEYWSAWQDAIEQLLAERAICTADDIAARGRAHDIDHGR